MTRDISQDHAVSSTAQRGQHRLAATLLALFVSLLAFTAQAAVPVPSPPTVNARAYILQDFDSGRVLAEANPDERMEPASLTKLMTAYIVFNEIKNGTVSPDEEVTISAKAWRTKGSRMFIEVNTRVTVDKLLKGMIVQSGNDASVALAEHVAGSEGAFAELMNNYAESLGMTGTHYVNATGLPHPEHYTTARDLAVLTRALIRQFPEYYNWHSIKKFTYNNISQYNRNKLLWRDESVDGVKTGHTDSAGYCLVSSAKRDDMRLISVVLGTKSEEARAQESQKLLNYGFRFFETHRLYAADKSLTTARIWKGAADNLQLGLQDDLYVTIPRKQYRNLDAVMNIDPEILAPVTKGKPYGTLIVKLQDDTVAQRPLIALHDIPEGGLAQRLTDEILLFFE